MEWLNWYTLCTHCLKVKFLSLTESELSTLNIKHHTYYRQNTQKVLTTEGINKNKNKKKLTMILPLPDGCHTCTSYWVLYQYNFGCNLCSHALNHPPTHTHTHTHTQIHTHTRTCTSTSKCCSRTTMQYRYSITHLQIIHTHVAFLIVSNFKNNIHLRREIWNNDLFNTHYPAQNWNFFTLASRCPSEQWTDTSISNGKHN